MTTEINPQSSQSEDSFEQSFYCLEYTFNYPRNKNNFGRLSADMQKQLYTSLMTKALDSLESYNVIDPTSVTYRFEECQDGTIHLHGCVRLIPRFYTRGIIETFCRAVLKLIDGRLRYERGIYNAKYYRYVSPMMCVQISEGLERYNKWISYINKMA